MIIFGSIDALQYAYNFVVINQVLNFNTMIEQVTQLNFLNPYWGNNITMRTDDYNFDMWYMTYLLSTPDAFRQLVDLMRIPYNGNNVWILVDFSMEGSVNIIESLIKYIQEIYGYTCNVVHVPEDLENLVQGTFSNIGIQTFDANMESYIQLFGHRNLPSDKD